METAKLPTKAFVTTQPRFHIPKNVKTHGNGDPSMRARTQSRRTDPNTLIIMTEAQQLSTDFVVHLSYETPVDNVLSTSN